MHTIALARVHMHALAYCRDMHTHMLTVIIVGNDSASKGKTPTRIATKLDLDNKCDKTI
jgi:hypothetical protein